MGNWLICWEGIASTKLFMVATLVSILPFMYKTRNFLYYFAHDCMRSAGDRCDRKLLVMFVDDHNIIRKKGNNDSQSKH